MNNTNPETYAMDTHNVFLERLERERNTVKRRCREYLEKILHHRAGSPNHGWFETQLADALQEHAEISAAIEAESGIERVTRYRSE